MSKPDVIYESHDSETSYRLRPNPDAELGVGFREGGILEWRDEGEKWSGYFFIAPESLEAIGIALLEAAKDVRKR